MGIKPFAEGNQAAKWKTKNCENCAKKFCHDEKKYHCRWERELDTAWMMNTEITNACALAIGCYEAGGFYTWDCPSLVKPGEPPSKGRGPVPGQQNLFNGGRNGE